MKFSVPHLCAAFGWKPNTALPPVNELEFILHEDSFTVRSSASGQVLYHWTAPSTNEMKMEIEGWLDPKLMRIWHDLAGHIALARNDVAQAIEHFEKAVSLLPYQYRRRDEHAWYYGSLAYAYYLSGDLAGAQEWHENILALTSGRLSFGETYAKSHFMLGKIYQQRGMKAEAIRSYRTFLDLWREADSPTPDLVEAKRSLAALLD